jgi:hypothetical protein
MLPIIDFVHLSDLQVLVGDSPLSAATDSCHYCFPDQSCLYET